jgi:hypothetical protein
MLQLNLSICCEHESVVLNHKLSFRLTVFSNAYFNSLFTIQRYLLALVFIISGFAVPEFRAVHVFKSDIDIVKFIVVKEF